MQYCDGIGLEKKPKNSLSNFDSKYWEQYQEMNKKNKPIADTLHCPVPGIASSGKARSTVVSCVSRLWKGWDTAKNVTNYIVHELYNYICNTQSSFKLHLPNFLINKSTTINVMKGGKFILV